MNYVARKINFQLIAVCIIHSIIHIILGIPIRSNLFATYSTRFNFNFSILEWEFFSRKSSTLSSCSRTSMIIQTASHEEFDPVRNRFHNLFDAGWKEERRRGENLYEVPYPRGGPICKEIGLGFDKPGRKKNILINIEMGNVQRDPETIENCTWKIWEINLKWKRRGVNKIKG